MTYRCEHFALYELVTREIFEARGARAWELLRPGPLGTLDAMRKRYGKITVNNWHWGGDRDEAGLRNPTTPTGARFSMHKYGGAFDPAFESVTPREVFDEIVARPALFPHITTLENVAMTPSWLHFDDRNHDRGGVWVVNP